jgi:hypothetical protein
MGIALKLQQVRVELQKRNVKKSGQNTYSKFSYYELADFLPIVNELFLAHKLASQFSLLKDRAELKIIDAESQEIMIFETVVNHDIALKQVTGMQVIGAVNTYAKRYCFYNALELTENDLLDSISGSEKVANNSVLSDKQLGLLQSLTANITSEALKTRLKTLYNVEALETLSIDQASDLITRIKNKG